MKFSWKGCLIGCGAVILLFVILIFASGYWLVKKGEYVPKGTILREDSEFFIRANLRAEDELLIEFFTQQLTQMNELSPVSGNLPGFFKDWQRGQTRGDIEKMLPMEVEISGSVEREDFNATVGFSVYNNLARFGFWLLKRSAAKEGHVQNFNGKEYLDVGDENDPFYFTLIDSILYVSKTQEGMEDILSEKLGDHSLDNRLGLIDLEQPIYGFVVGQAAPLIVDDILSKYNAQDMPAEASTLTSSIEQLRFNLGMADQSSMAGDLFVQMPVNEQTRAFMEQVLESLAKDSQLTLKTEMQEEETGFLVRFQISGFEDVYESLEERIEKQVDQNTPR